MRLHRDLLGVTSEVEFETFSAEYRRVLEHGSSRRPEDDSIPIGTRRRTSNHAFCDCVLGPANRITSIEIKRVTAT